MNSLPLQQMYQQKVYLTVRQCALMVLVWSLIAQLNREVQSSMHRYYFYHCSSRRCCCKDFYCYFIVLEIINYFFKILSLFAILLFDLSGLYISLHQPIRWCCFQVSDFLSKLHSRIPYCVEPTTTGALRCVVALAAHHLEDVLQCLWKYPLPYDRQELLCYTYVE